MIPIEQISLVSPTEAKPGRLLRFRDRDMPPLFTAEWHDVMHGFALDNVAELSVPFHLVPLPDQPFLDLGQPTLLVDETSIVSPTREIPAPGVAFYWKGRVGLIARGQSGFIYVGLDGSITEGQPADWSAFVGFSRWKLVIPVDGSDDPLPGFERIPSVKPDGAPQ